MSEPHPITASKSMAADHALLATFNKLGLNQLNRLALVVTASAEVATGRPWNRAGRTGFWGEDRGRPDEPFSAD